jgi:hypothetical protein
LQDGSNPYEATNDYGVPQYAPYGATRNTPRWRNDKPDPRQSQELIARWKAADADQRKQLESSLREMLKREFNARLMAHEQEIKELEAKVRELRERLALRREKQDEIVDHRLQQILREAQGLGWGSEGFGGQNNPFYWEGTMSKGPQSAAVDWFAPGSAENSLFGSRPEEDPRNPAESADSESALAPAQETARP